MGTPPITGNSKGNTWYKTALPSRPHAPASVMCSSYAGTCPRSTLQLLGVRSCFACGLAKVIHILHYYSAYIHTTVHYSHPRMGGVTLIGVR